MSGAQKKFPAIYRHLIAFFVFLAISLIYFSPIFQGKQLFQNDVQQTDGFSKEALDYHKATGEYVPWTNSMFSGMPTTIGISPYQRNFLPQILYIPYNLLGYFSFETLLFLMLGMYVLLYVLKVDFVLALLCSLAYGLFSFNVDSIIGGHIMKVFEISLIPPVIAGFILIFNKKYLSGLIVLLFTLSISVAVNHTQILYYLFILLVVLSLVKLVESIIRKEFKHILIGSSLLLVAGLLAVASNFAILNTLEQSKLTTRGESTGLGNREAGLDKGYASDWSLGFGETFTLLVPNLYGGSSSDYFVSDKKSESYKALRQAPDEQTADYLSQQTSQYFGNQPFVGGGYYVGILVCILFIFGLIAVSGSTRIWLGTSFLIFLVIAWGKNMGGLYDFMFEYLPLYKSFRIPSMAVSLSQIIMVVTAALGLNRLLSGEMDQKELKRTFLISSGIVSGFLLLFLLVPGMFLPFLSNSEAEAGFPDWFTDALIADRQSVVQSDVLRSLLFAALFSAIGWLFIIGKLKNKTVFIALISILFVTDIWMISRRHIGSENFVKVSKGKPDKIFALDAEQQRIKNDPDPHFRVLNLSRGNPFSDAITSYNFKSVGGYHGAKLKRYQELIENQLMKNNLGVLSMLNTKYIIMRNPRTGETVVQQNPVAAGNAWFPPNLKMVNSADEEMFSMNNDSTNRFNPLETAIVNKEFADKVQGLQPGIDSTAFIRLTKYAPAALSYESKSSKDQLAVFSEIIYKLDDGDGWKATIDGQPAEYIRANYVLRAMKIPAGEHKIEFWYDADKALMRYKVSFIFTIVTCLSIVLVIVLSRRKNFSQYL